MKDLEKLAEGAREALQHAVFDALDEKRRLGQYAVIYEDGKILHIGPEEIEKRIAPLRAKYGADSAQWPSAEPAAGFEVRESDAEFEDPDT